MVLFHYLRHRLHWLAVLALLALLIGQLGEVYWAAELLSHFLPYYALAFLLACLLAPRKWRIVWGAALALTLFWLIQPFHLWQGQSGTAPAWRLIWYNVHMDNPGAQKERDRLLAEQAEIVAFAEINVNEAGWQTLHQSYPYSCQHHERSPFALALWSRQPLQSCEVRWVDNYPYIRAQHNDGTVIYALHPPPPVHQQFAREQQDYFQQIAPHIARETNVLVVGDLNSTPFSPVWRQFVEQSHLQAATPYYTPTWKPYFLNIDHVLIRTSNGQQVSVTPLSWRDSDHRPLRVDWQLPTASAK